MKKIAVLALLACFVSVPAFAQKYASVKHDQSQYPHLCGYQMRREMVCLEIYAAFNAAHQPGQRMGGSERF